MAPADLPGDRISPPPRRAVDEHLTPRQRQIFVAIVLNGVPMDAMVSEFDSTRNAIYKGYLNEQASRRS